MPFQKSLETKIPSVQTIFLITYAPPETPRAAIIKHSGKKRYICTFTDKSILSAIPAMDGNAGYPTPMFCEKTIPHIAVSITVDKNLFIVGEVFAYIN
jgi:hypothetical protein